MNKRTIWVSIDTEDNQLKFEMIVSVPEEVDPVSYIDEFLVEVINNPLTDTVWGFADGCC